LLERLEVFLLEVLVDFLVEDAVVLVEDFVVLFVLVFEDEGVFALLVVESFFWLLFVTPVGFPSPSEITLPRRVTIKTNLRSIFP